MIFIDGYPIDVAVTEEHSFENEVTDHPVEKGSSIADHVRPKPNTVTVEGLVSDTPLSDVSQFRTAFSDGSIPSREAFARLDDLRTSRQIVTVTTSLRDYDNMVVQSISVPRDAKTGNALRFKAIFKQIRVVDTERATVRITDAHAKKKVSKGTVPPKPGEEVPESAKAKKYSSDLIRLQDGAKELAASLAED